MSNPAPPNSTAMGPWMATALVMGLMIGSGVFLLPAQLAPYGWNAVAAWGLSIGGAMALAVVIARLTVAVPDAEGPIGFVSAAFGAVPAFMIGWSYWVGCIVASVTMSVAAMSYLSVFAPQLAAVPYLPAGLAVLLLWAVTLINMYSARAVGGFQLVTMAFKLIPLLLVIVILAGLFGKQGAAALAPFPSAGLSFSEISSAATLTLWALVGFEAASTAAARVDRPEINIPRATLWGTGLTGLLYIIVCSGIALTLPMALVAHSDAPFAAFVEHFWARGPSLFIALFAAIAAIGAINANNVPIGESPLVMARQGTLPRWIGVTASNGMPVRALVLASVLASIFVVSNGSKTMGDLFAFLAKLATCAALWLYLGCAFAALRLKIARPFAVIGAVYGLWAMWGAGIEASGLSFLLMGAGLPFYWWAQREAAENARGEVAQAALHR